MNFLYHAGRDLYYKGKEGSGPRLVLRNRTEIECALKECHDAPGSGGHKGVNITLRKVEETYHWKALTLDVRDWVTDTIMYNAQSDVFYDVIYTNMMVQL